jgi:CRISPR-associated protein Csx17
MSELELSGCQSTQLAGYLSALGIHRAVARTLDDAAEGYWHGDTYRLTSRFATIDELAAALNARFEPESIVAPWNSGSGFSTAGKSKSATEVVDWIRGSSDTRLAALRVAVADSDRVISEALRMGISDVWDKKWKTELLRLCRNELPDAAVAWMDAALALGQDDSPAYSRLLGTGGNFGRQELSVNYLQQARSVMTDSHSLGWLLAVLDGQQRGPYPKKNSPGQFDPSGVGVVADGETWLANPWTFLFVIEGILLFATAVVRRYGSAYARAALPFQVSGSTAGFTSSAAGEDLKAELWAPEWPQPSSISDITHLLGEGRADWDASPARSGLDMVRASATLGVDRGITAFNRYVFVDRLGQNPMVVPAGRIEVSARGGVDLLAPLDRWREALRRADPPPDTAARLKSLDQTVYDHSCTGTPAALVEVFAALGLCLSAATRSGKVRQSQLPELLFPNGDELLNHLRDAFGDDREFRLAVSLASSRDHERTLATWLSDPPLAGGLAAGLADIARRRGFPLATKETIHDRAPSVRGARIAFEHGMRLRSGDIVSFLDGDIDDDRAAALLLGLSCIDWRHSRSEQLPGGSGGPAPSVDLLMPFTGIRPLDYTGIDGQTESLFIRPGHDWVPQLLAGHLPEVLHDASRRLRIAGLRHVVAVPDGPHDCTRVAAALLMNTTAFDRRAALARIALIGSHRIPSTEEETA